MPLISNYTANVCVQLEALTIIQSFSYEAWSSKESTTAGHNKGLSAAFNKDLQLLLGISTRHFCPKQFSAVHCHHALSFSEGNWVVSKMLNKCYISKVGEWVWQWCGGWRWRWRQGASSTFVWYLRSPGNTRQFGTVPCDPNGIGWEADDCRWPTPHYPPHCIEFFRQVFTQASPTTAPPCRSCSLNSQSTAYTYTAQALCRNGKNTFFMSPTVCICLLLLYAYFITPCK
jgi:hypothetical protein